MGKRPIITNANARVVFAGDAAHALPFNLAQGASLAIEDGYHLGVLLGALVNEQKRDETPSSSSSTSGFEKVFASYERERRRRYQCCRHITQVTRWIAAPKKPLPESIRNGIRFVPPLLNSFVFDLALHYSLDT